MGSTSGQVLEDPFKVAKIFLASGLAGAVSRTATAPIDRLRMLLIVQEGRQPLTLYQGLKKMAAEGSVRAYFKGNAANVLKIVPETAIKLTAADMIKNSIAQDPARVEQGLRGFYRGLTPAMLGIIPYAGVDITCFEIMKEALVEIHYPNKPPDMLIISAGMFSSCVAQVVSFPLNMVRTRLQAQKPEPYADMWDAFSKTIQKEGYRGLYKGLLPNMVKLAPAQGISWYVYYKTRLLLGVHDVRRQAQTKPQQKHPNQITDQDQQQQILQQKDRPQQQQQLLMKASEGQSQGQGQTQGQGGVQRGQGYVADDGISWGNMFMVGVMLSPLLMYGVIKNWRRIQYKRQLSQYKVMGV